VKREMAILFFVKRDLDPPLPPSAQHVYLIKIHQILMMF